MTHSFNAYPSVSMVLQEDFASSSQIHEIFARVIGKDRPDLLSSIDCSVDAIATDGGLKLRFVSRMDGLTEEATITHKFFFIDRDEVRERVHLLDPSDPQACTELLILFPEDMDRDYCHASVYDADNHLLAVYAVVFDRNGRLVHYPFTERYVSPLELDHAQLTETRDEEGCRVLRFTVALKNLTTPERVFIAWEAIGLTHRHELLCDPDQPVVFDDLKLDDNSRLAPGDWVAIAVDEKDRVLAQTIVTLVPAFAATHSWPG
jgi:hypothetical protein